MPPRDRFDPQAAPPATCAGGERRASHERRRRIWWSVFYGSFSPRRRTPPRRLDESRFHSLDWHSAHLLALAMGILLLSVADAFMTVTLMAAGAVEVNPIMDAVLHSSTTLFAAAKMALTGLGVLFMVYVARYRVLKIIRVESVLYAIFFIYAGLLSYEFWMLRAVVDIAAL